jgi:phosphoglycerate dehydrogenase-like enzyme
MDPIDILVISNPSWTHLKVLEKIPDPVNIRVGLDPDFLREEAPKADVILNGNFSREPLRSIFPLAQKAKWVHSLSAGVDNMLFPELIDSPVPVTNAKGVFKESLAEFAIAGILYFAKDLRRMIRNQEAGRWEQFDVDMVSGHVLGVVGYGEIGRAAAKLARCLGMKIAAVRRRTTLSDDDPKLEAVFPPDRLRDMLAMSDYVLVAAALTPETRGMIGEAELDAMKTTAVIINVGRGPIIVESALIAALEQNRIRGAALDVFEVEPLPEGHPFYRMPNLLLSPHCADHTIGWLEMAMDLFVENVDRFRRGQPLKNIIDKHAGY